MFSASAVRVHEVSASRLVVVCPPFSAAAISVFVLTAIMSAGIWLMVGRDLRMRDALIILASDLPFLLVSLGLATTTSSAVLDSRADTAQVRTTILGIPVRQNSFPLSSLKGTVIESSKRSGRLSFRLRDGTLVSLGFFTNQPGLEIASAAVNRFLLQQRLD